MALAPQQFCVRWNSYHTNLQTVFPKLLSTENFADVTLACESRQLRCHKVVLSACSAYFERLLVQNPCKHPIIFMKDMRFSEMQSLVDFMYKGEVNVAQDDLPSLLKSAEALQIRGLCSSDAGGEPAEAPGKATQTGEGRDCARAGEALLHQLDCRADNNGPARCGERNGAGAAGAGGARRRAQPELKEERVEEDGLFYGELDGEQMEFQEDEESGKAGGSIGQGSANQPLIRVKPESKLLQAQKDDYIARLSKMTSFEIQSEFAKYGFNTQDDAKMQDDDFYKAWLEQNGELEVSLLKSSARKGQSDASSFLNKSLLETTLMKSEQPSVCISKPEPPKKLKRGRPPLKDKVLASSLLKTDLDQFLEGKEVSSSGLSRRDLEKVMMGKFNPNRRYSNEAMWAALMDVKRGGSIYRAAQTHKVPRKSLRNWMKRCHIKSSFPMPQQLKQFVENNRRQRLECPGEGADTAHGTDFTLPLQGSNAGQYAYGPDVSQAVEWLRNAQKLTGELSQDVKQNFERDMEFGKHFLDLAGSNVESSGDEATTSHDAKITDESTPKCLNVTAKK